MGGMERVNRIWNHPAYQEAPYLSICRYYDHSNGIGAALYFVDQFIREI